VLTEIADGVFVRQSEFCLSNAIVVRGSDGALLVDPGVNGDDLAELADDLETMGLVPIVGFSTHPHWDHVLWDARFGDVVRYGTRECAETSAARIGELRDRAAEEAPGATLDLIGRIAALPESCTDVPLSGRTVQVVEHRAHAPGHAALLLPEPGVLVAGDMLSDVEIPLLHPSGPVQDLEYLAALDLLEAACGTTVGAVVPGHGSVARGPEIRSRIAADRAYLQALAEGVDPRDPRVGPDASYGTDWLPGAHESNARLVALRASSGLM
jgi:glyoxylase-like metal-dependent hydrolase (beta-lactamase superfamily II)